jgi:hypothetical protein
MTKGAALHQFFSGFGMDAYAASSVPEDAVFPYLTHDLVTDSFDNGEVSLTVNLWWYTESEAIPNAKVEEISKAIGMGGHLIECDGGYIWLKRGSPFAQSLKDDTAPNIKRRYLNISAEYFTTD